MADVDTADQVRALATKLERSRPSLEKLDRYYDGEQPTSFLSAETRAMVGDRLTEVIAGFPALVIDRREHRLDVEGFRLAGSEDASDEIWNEWQRQDLDEESGQVHVDALLYGRSYMSVWAEESGAVLVAAETPLQVTVDRDPATRRIRSALKRYTDGDETFAFLHLPDVIEKFKAPARSGAQTRRWEKFDELPNPSGVVTMVPFVHRRRSRRPDGQSVLHHVLPLVDVINKLATDLMVTAEFHAEPRRFMTGMQIPSNPGQLDRFRQEVKEFYDELSKGRTMVGGQGVNIGQLAAADLSNFTAALGMFVGWLAAMAALPLTAVGISTENPASAEALRATETNLVKDSERIQRGFSGSWENVVRLMTSIERETPVAELGDDFRRMETIWRDAGTPTVAQVWDAATKGVGSDIIARQTAQELVGMSPEQRRRDAEYRENDAAAAATATVRAQVALARELESEDGLSKNASLAAAGLLEAARQNSTTAA